MFTLKLLATTTAPLVPKLATLLLCVALTVLVPGCASQKLEASNPAVEVQVQVPVPCKAPQIKTPTLYFDTQATPDMAVDGKVALLLAQDYSLKAYAAQLAAALDACRLPTPEELKKSP